MSAPVLSKIGASGVQNKPGAPPKDDQQVKVKGIFITAGLFNSEDKLSYYLDLCGRTELNAIVTDVKDDRGLITMEATSDTKKKMLELKRRGIYTIARIVCFKDQTMGNLRPELAIKNMKGAIWRDSGGNAWLDPYNFETWEYIVEVSLEAARAGFDEVQMDYVRFPSDGRLAEIDYGDDTETKSKADIISEFLSYARNRLAKENAKVKISADIFGITAVNRGDIENIGQDMELLIWSADVLCPMIYPSHFANRRQNGKGQEINGILFEAPDLFPYDIVYNTLLKLKERLPA